MNLITNKRMDKNSTISQYKTTHCSRILLACFVSLICLLSDYCQTDFPMSPFFSNFGIPN